MGGDDELGMARVAHFGEYFEQFYLTSRREGRLRFVQQAETFDLIAALEVRHERLTMRLGHQRFATKVLELAGIRCRPLVQDLGKLTEYIGSKKRPGHETIRPFEGKVLVKLVFAGVEFRTVSLGISPDKDITCLRESLQQSRFACAVLADK